MRQIAHEQVHMKAPIESGCKSILKTLPHLRPPDHRKRRQSQEPRNRWDSPRQARPGWSPGAWPGQHQPRRWLLRQRTLATTSIITSPSPNVDSPAQVVTGAGVDRNILRRSSVTSLSGFLPAQRDINIAIKEKGRTRTCRPCVQHVRLFQLCDLLTSVLLGDRARPRGSCLPGQLGISEVSI